MAKKTPQEKAAFKIAKRLVDDNIKIIFGQTYEGDAISPAREIALITAKEMMKAYKKGFNVTGADHSYTNTTGYAILKQLPKEIRKYKID